MSDENINILIKNLSLKDYIKVTKDISKLEQENQQLKKQKDDVVEYIKSYDVFKEFSFPLMKKWEENQVKSSIDYQFKESIKKDLLRMLGEIDDN